MTSSARPAVLPILEHEPNQALDAVVVDALPALRHEPDLQEAYFSMLLRRGHDPSLARLVGGIHEADDRLAGMIVGSVADLYAAIRLAIASEQPHFRAGAIAVIERSDCAKLAYLLADALRIRCPRTRELAAKALHAMTARAVEASPPQPEALQEPVNAADAPNRQRYTLLEGALREAFACWELHLRPEVVEAALWMDGATEPKLRERLAEPRGRLAQVINGLIVGARDPRLAGFVLRALAIPELRASAVAAISHTKSTAFRQALIAQVWRLGDPEIERGCRWIRNCPWLQESVDGLLAAGADREANAVRLVLATGGPSARRYALMGALVDNGGDEFAEAVVDRLVEDSSSSATTLLTTISSRNRGQAAISARRELDHRQRETGMGVALGNDATKRHDLAHEHEPAAANGSATISPILPALQEACASDTENSTASPKHPALSWTAARDPRVRLRAQLAAISPTDRTEALHLLRDMGFVSELSEQVYHLCYDVDPLVRSDAVATLAQLPGSTSRRILRAAMSDPDQRVQANAVEALDRLNVPDRLADTYPKLSSPNNRIRANAVKSLLRLDVRDAGDTLLSMLEDDSSAHRISALWLIEQLHLQSVLRRVASMVVDDPDQRVRRRARRVFEDMNDRADTRAGEQDGVSTPSKQQTTGDRNG